MIGVLAREATLIVAVLALLTRLPLPDLGWEPGRLARALRYLPLGGALVGGVGALVWLGAGALWPPPVAALIAVAVQVALTGALHEDGLADCADALGAGGTPERRLAVMRDPRLGSFGVAALGLDLGLRVALVAGLAPLAGAAALALAGGLGRAAILGVAAAVPPAQAEGMGAALGAGPGRVELMVGAGLTLALTAPAGPAGWGALAAAAVAAALVARAARRRLGGQTGDVLGAAAALAELAALGVLAAAWGRG